MKKKRKKRISRLFRFNKILQKFSYHSPQRHQNEWERQRKMTLTTSIYQYVNVKTKTAIGTNSRIVRKLCKISSNFHIHKRCFNPILTIERLRSQNILVCSLKPKYITCSANLLLFKMGISYADFKWNFTFSNNNDLCTGGRY